jgi:hypothetical protein
LRFPEGRRRLEDHVFVLGALFRTDRVSILADYPCYHWVLRDRQTNASAHEFDPAVYYANLREVLDVVDEHTEPGPMRDRLYTRWYRGKVLSRVGGTLFLNRAPDARRARFEDIRRLMEERFPPRLDEPLPFLLGVRAALVRAGRMEPLERLAELERTLVPWIAVADVQLAPGAIALRLEATADDPQGLLRFEVGEAGTTWRPPAVLARDVPDACLDAARITEPGDAQLLLRRVEDPEEFLVPTEASVRLVPDPGAPQRARVALDLDARIATATAAAGRPLRPGRYVLRAVVGIAGARIDGPVTLGPHRVRLVLAIDQDGTPSLARASVRQRLAARAPGLRRLVVRAKRTLRS